MRINQKNKIFKKPFLKIIPGINAIILLSLRGQNIPDFPLGVIYGLVIGTSLICVHQLGKIKLNANSI